MAQLHAYAFTSVAQDLTFDASEPATFTALYAISDRRCLELLQVQVPQQKRGAIVMCKACRAYCKGSRDNTVSSVRSV